MRGRNSAPTLPAPHNGAADAPEKCIGCLRCARCALLSSCSGCERRSAGKQSGDVTALLSGCPALTPRPEKQSAEDRQRKLPDVYPGYRRPRDRWSLESCLCDSSPATKQRRCSDPDRCRYRCSVAMCDGKSSAQTVTQMSAQETVRSGHSMLLECTYKVSGTPYPAWYVQYPGKAPVMLVNDLTQKTHKGFSVLEDKVNKGFHLKKENVEVTDGGVYFCAVRDTVDMLHLSPVTEHSAALTYLLHDF
ncbi:unnamed protein product [Ranitomeya imitator]|uniref:Ig-like domain-containing protein n=1 Tax=Ranitomeya imitator TaxID=111125 RepID=A0ABN9KUP0_9NEOB|nr:unnamed protein product [Ranitomeya imitator]